MRVAILDDWFDTLRTLPCFERLDGHDVTVFTDHVQETDPLARRLQGLRTDPWKTFRRTSQALTPAMKRKLALE